MKLNLLGACLMGLAEISYSIDQYELAAKFERTALINIVSATNRAAAGRLVSPPA